VTTDENQTVTGTKVFNPAATNAVGVEATGNAGGAGIKGHGGVTNGIGVQGIGNGSGAGVTAQASSGSALVASSASGPGAELIGNATRAPLFLTPQVAPSGSADGDAYVDTGDNTTKVHVNGAWRTVATRNEVQTFTQPQTITPTSGTDAVTATGNGVGAGLSGVGGATNGTGVKGTGNGSGDGLTGTGGAGSGRGVTGNGGGTNGIGVDGEGAGTGAGVRGQCSGGTGPGVAGVSGSAGPAVLGTALNNGDAVVGDASAGSGHGAVLSGSATTAPLRLVPSPVTATYPTSAQVGDICVVQSSFTGTYNIFAWLGTPGWVQLN
jgi:hypothetical protein